ncbi:MAG: hypothetical protein J6M64_13285, partial [Oscillospiraceae bacterium]|nr:hypothetical protein [Oscillospiraceae bacterium]
KEKSDEVTKLNNEVSSLKDIKAAAAEAKAVFDSKDATDAEKEAAAVKYNATIEALRKVDEQNKVTIDEKLYKYGDGDPAKWDNEIAKREAVKEADIAAIAIYAVELADAKSVGDKERAIAKVTEDYEKIENPTAVDTAKYTVALNKLNADWDLDAAKATLASAKTAASDAQKAVVAAQKAAKGVISDVVALAKVDAAATIATAQAVAYAAAAAEFETAVANLNTEVANGIANALKDLGY